MDAYQGSIIATGALSILSAALVYFAQRYKKECAILSEYVPLLLKEKDTAIILLKKLSDFYRNAKAASKDGIITPEEFERLGRQGYEILNSEEVRRLLEGSN